MREQVWFIVSKTDERRYATTRPPAGEWVETLKRDGYAIFRIEFEMPEDWDANTDDTLRIDPVCMTCGRRWIPAEGEDATQVPCLGCQITKSVGEIIKLVMKT